MKDKIRQIDNVADFTAAQYSADQSYGLYGNAIFMMGGDRGIAFPERMDPIYAAQKNGPFQCQVQSGPECKRLLCRRLNSSIGVYTACSTHLTANAANVAPSQCADARWTVEHSYSFQNQVVAGDFNLGNNYMTPLRNNATSPRRQFGGTQIQTSPRQVSPRIAHMAS
jgi:hypothetical protein